MNSFYDFWNNLGRRGRIGFGAGLVLIALVVAAAAFLTLRVPYGVLFSGLGDTDLASMAGELDKMKVPYRVGDDNATLLVPEAQVRKTRLALMGRDLPLHGAVGFELFNNVEFGVSEFVQKVNYQRALQGELTRTILAIDEVQNARVHLALPEQGLFRKDTQKAKASVSITTKTGRTLTPVQVQGIQRLVAASVPDIQAQDVTVLDQHGVPLSRLASADGAGFDAAGSSLLDQKRSVENYLAHKASDVLDRTFGKDEAVVSVDAVFVQQQTQVTTEEVLPAKGGDPAAVPTGVIVRERQSSRDSDGTTAAPATPSVSNTETEYQVGHRTEQVSSPAGGIQRLEVAVVLRHAMPEADVERVREIVAASIGIDKSRGDVVAVEAMDAPAAQASQPAVADASTDAEAPAPHAEPQDHHRHGPGHVVVLVLAALLLLVLGAALVWRTPRRAGERPLTEAERARMLKTVQDWVAHGTPPAAP